MNADRNLTPNRERGKFIVIEGIDGSGTTTQVEALARAIGDKIGVQVATQKEPTDRPVGQLIKKILKKEIMKDVPTEHRDRILLGLFKEDRRDHFYNESNSITLLLERGIWVISDRFTHSSYAYNCTTSGDRENVLRQFDEFPYPDITFWLHLDYKIAVDRLTNRFIKRIPFTDFEIYENDKKLEMAAKGYLELFAKHYKGSWFRIEADRDEEKITSEMIHLIRLLWIQEGKKKVKPDNAQDKLNLYKY